MSGHTVEGAEFFQKTPTVDLRSLLEDMQVMGPWESLSDEQTEAQFAALGDTSYKGKVRCKCRCGYSCGRRCDLPLEQCLREHYGRDCEHVWDGPWEEYSMGGSKTCSKCGDSAMGHDMAVGP